MQVFLVFGRTGWIGGLLGQLLTDMGAKWEYANARLEDRSGVIADIDRVRVLIVKKFAICMSGLGRSMQGVRVRLSPSEQPLQ